MFSYKSIAPYCLTFQTMAEGVEIRKGKGKLKRLNTDEVAEKLTPDEVEDFRDAFEVMILG